MLKNNLITAVRHMGRNRFPTFLNIVGMAAGLACCLLIFLWVRDERGIDGFHANGHDIYRVIQDVKFSGREISVAVTPGLLAPSLLRDVPEIARACRLRHADLRFENGDRWLTESVTLADPSFLEMFSFPLLRGDPAEALSAPDSIILSEEMARKYFPDGDPVGKALRAEGRFVFRVTGVLKTPPRNSVLGSDFFVPFAFGREIGFPVDAWDDSRFTTFVQLAEGVAPAAVAAKVAGHLEGKPTAEKETRLALQPLREMYFRAGLAGEPFPLGDIRAVRVFSLAAVFILFIACLNFMNLATASSAGRAREVGARKISGAGRKQLIGQFLGESLLLTFASLALALLLVQLLLPILNRIAAKDLAFSQLTSAGTPFLVAGLAILAGLLAGSYPALFLSSFQPARVLKGDLALGARGRTFRKILFIGQFSLAVLFLISFTFIREQLVFLRSHDPGFEKERILTLAMGEDTRVRFGALREELLRLPGVLGVAAASNAPTRGWMYSNSLWDWPGKDPRQEILMRGTCADVGYFDLMGIEILQGRDFVEADDAETNIQWIINEEAAGIMGFRDPVGRPLAQGEFRGTIVGLVKNHHVTSLKEKIDPLVIGYNPPLSRILFAKLRPGDLSGTIRSMEPLWQKFASRDEFKPQFLTDAMDALYRSEERIEVVLRWFSTLAVLIACLGLFGLATFLAERRTKEIGIRRTLGATTGSILLLFSREFIWGIIAANALAWPAAFLFVRSWLRNYAARISLGPGPFLYAAALSLLLALATVNIRFIRAARSRPAETLKHE